MEIERKWMVTGWPRGMSLTEDYQMDQGYISVRPTVRIRREALQGGATALVLCFKGAGTLSREEIETILETLSGSEEYGMILRAKGMVEGKDGQWIYFDMVPGEADIRTGSPDYTGRLCVIGSKLQEEKIAELFGVA